MARKNKKLTICLLIPCYNEEKSVRQSAESWLAQTRAADQIIVVNDCSKDNTLEILAEFKDRLTVVTTPHNTGNKSSAQEYGLKFVKSDILVATDGDTLLHKDFLKKIEEDFRDKSVAAVGGYVKSLKYNWLTSCRALDYAIGQNIDKIAQDCVNHMLVIPGAAGAFRVKVFKELGFDHDTLTEDLDFTYKLHKLGYRIKYDREAICYTQDPSSLNSYINQMRRWFGGGWQNFLKHAELPQKPGMALEIGLVYVEGLAFSLLLFVLPFLNLLLALIFLFLSFCIVFLLAVFAAIKERRIDFLYIIPQYLFLKYVNAWLYLEQFVKEVILRRKNMVWFKPERIQMERTTI